MLELHRNECRENWQSRSSRVRTAKRRECKNENDKYDFFSSHHRSCDFSRRRNQRMIAFRMHSSIQTGKTLKPSECASVRAPPKYTQTHVSVSLSADRKVYALNARIAAIHQFIEHVCIRNRIEYTLCRTHYTDSQWCGKPIDFHFAMHFPSTRTMHRLRHSTIALRIAIHITLSRRCHFTVSFTTTNQIEVNIPYSWQFHPMLAHPASWSISFNVFGKQHCNHIKKKKKKPQTIQLKDRNNRFDKFNYKIIIVIIFVCLFCCCVSFIVRFLR